MTPGRVRDYVHGYADREADRLVDQADAVRTLLHHDTAYSAGARVLEAGCGVGAQTITLARNSPRAWIASVDISLDSLRRARAAAHRAEARNVAFSGADLFALPFEDRTFDHVFVCYVLEHLRDPVGALVALRGALKEGGSITVIEGDHGSCFFHPMGRKASHAWECLIEVQESLGGDPRIGRRLHPLLADAGFHHVHVSPRIVYGDQSKPDVVEAFWERTIIPMVEGVEAQAIEDGLIDRAAWDKGIRELQAVSRSVAGTFAYTFFKAVGTK